MEWMQEEVRSMYEGMKAVPKIAELRDKAGLTQRELSLLVGVTENTIQNWERGRSLVEQIERLTILCRILKCNLEDLIEYVPAPDEVPKRKGRSLAQLRQMLGTDKPPETTETKAAAEQAGTHKQIPDVTREDPRVLS